MRTQTHIRIYVCKDTHVLRHVYTHTNTHTPHKHRGTYARSVNSLALNNMTCCGTA